MGIGGDSDCQHSAEELSARQPSVVLGLCRGLAMWHLEEVARAQAMVQRGKAAGEGSVLPHLAVPQEMHPACAGRALLHLPAPYQIYHWQAGILSAREKRADMKGFLSAALQ